MDRTTDIVSGIAPKGLQVELQVVHAYGFGAGATTTLYRTASSAGTYGADFTSKVNIAGGDRLSVIVRYPNGDAVDLVGYVPQAVVRIGQPGFLASFTAAQSGYVTLKNAAGTVRARGYVHEDPNDQYDAGRFTWNGVSVAPRIGDSVSASFGIPSFVIPAIGVGFNLGTSTVAGSCPKSRPLSIQVVDSADSQVYAGLATCSAAGTYSVTTAPTRTLVNGDRVVVAARLPGGDIVSRQRIVVP